MNFRPVNRYVLIEKILKETKKIKSGDLMGFDFEYANEKPQLAIDKTTLCFVRGVSLNTGLDLKEGEKIVVQTIGIEEVIVGDYLFCVIPENYVIGVVE